MKTVLLILSVWTVCQEVYSQDSASLKKQWQLSGYVKDMESFQFDKRFNHLVTGNLLHNRVNIKWKPSGYLQAAAEFRTRLFWGDEIQETPDFVNKLRNENEAVNLSALWVNNNHFVLHTNTERLWVEYRRTKWNVRAGRQRINWGIATTWNPCDIFNTYNFLDFDYEERPGSDAVKMQYLFNDYANIEIAGSASGAQHGGIAAARYSINKWGYDMQFIAGVYQHQFTAGVGWAGSIWNIGFKGEWQFFLSQKTNMTTMNATTELDYVFKKGWYLDAAVLLNDNGINEPVTDWSKLDFRFTPQNMMPARWNFIITSSKEITPLFSGRLSIVYSPGMNLFILLPSFQYNLPANLDASLVWQSFFFEMQQKLQAASHGIFIRLKWTFR